MKFLSLLALVFSMQAMADDKIIFTQGDDQITITMQLKDENNAGISLTGATFETKIKGAVQTFVTIPNDQHTADPDQTTNKGKFTMTMTAAQTGACKPGDTKEIVTKVVQSGVTIYYHGRDLLQVLPKTPID
jgi:hypothetical protein